MADVAVPSVADCEGEPVDPVQQGEFSVPTRLCPICLSPVPVGARICLACKSDLSWRRYLSISNTSLALLTALISVLAASAPVIKSLLTPTEAVIHLSLVQAPLPNASLGGPLAHTASEEKPPNKLVILVTNSGRHDGILIPTGFTFEWGSSPQHGVNTGLTSEDGLPVFVKPGEAKLITAVVGPLLTPQRGTAVDDVETMLKTKGWQKTATCQATFVTVDLQGKRKLTKAEDDCSRFALLVVNLIYSGIKFGEPSPH